MPGALEGVEKALGGTQKEKQTQEPLGVQPPPFHGPLKQRVLLHSVWHLVGEWLGC